MHNVILDSSSRAWISNTSTHTASRILRPGNKNNFELASGVSSFPPLFLKMTFVGFWVQMTRLYELVVKEQWWKDVKFVVTEFKNWNLADLKVEGAFGEENESIC